MTRIMELTELQKMWKELDERITRNELIHKEEISTILKTRKHSYMDRLMTIDKMAFYLTSVATIVFFYLCLIRSIYKLYPDMVIIGGIITIGGSIMLAGRVKQLKKIQKENNLEKQNEYVVRYKRLFYRTELAGWLLCAVFIVDICFHNNPDAVWWVIVMFCVAFILDHFIYHHVRTAVKGIISTNKELKDMR